MDVVDRQRAEPADEASPAPPPPHRARSVLALVLGLVALVCAAALPLAPVQMAVPEVSWPLDPQRPEPTMLELTNQTPLSLDVRFTCAAVRAAGATDDGVLLATLVPDHPVDARDGLVVTVRDGQLRVADRGRTVLREAPPAGECAYRVVGSTDRLTVERDGAVVGEVRAAGDGEVLPDVDVLTTSIDALPGEDLSVRLTVDDQFDTTPSPVKKVLVAVLLVAALGSVVLLWSADRARRRAPGPDGGARPRPRGDPLLLLVDVAVVGTLLLWLFLAPPGDDDGYYAAMARNASAEGFVGNYYQLLNQSFTPFTWFYRVLGWWQEVGDSPVVLRVPALAAGLGTWLLVRRYVSRPGALPAPLGGTRRGRRRVVLVAAACFLAWWLPYGMGVRPEAIVGVLAVAALVGVLRGLERERFLPVGLAVGAAGLAVVCHPTGFVALAPLLVALPRLVRLVRAGTTTVGALGRGALLLAPFSFAAAAAFADGSLRDFQRGQEIFLSIQEQNAWYDEYQRYAFLLQQSPMGAYAKRTAVLLAIAALAWFLVVAVAARARSTPLPAPLLLAGQSLAAAFLLLWITPSKWTHHFGALAGLGPAFLALFLVSVVVVVRRAYGGRPAGPGVPFLVLGSLVVVAALSLRGPNAWPYSWLPGQPDAFEPPDLQDVPLGSVALWVGIALVVLGACALRSRRRGERGARPWLVAAPVLSLVVVLLSLGFLLGSFGLATYRTLDGYSPWADALRDPLAADCGAAAAVNVLDPATAEPLAPAAGVPEPDTSTAFVDGGGWSGTDDPPEPAASGDVWGSLVTPGAEDGTGTVETPWSALPALEDDERVVVLAAGRLAGGNTLEVEFAAAAGDGDPRVLHRQTLQDAVDSPAWRSFALDVAAARDEGADLVRVVAGDHSGGPGGWLAFTGPSVTRTVPLAQYLPADAPVALAWQIAFLFPCQRQPDVRHGITEPVEYAVLWRDPAGNGMDDNTWQVFRGGLFAPVRRTSGITELAVELPSAPGLRNLQVFRFDVPYPVDGYRLDVPRVSRTGWAGPPEG
ncbi:arabinosyltransferase domain-containing protein [Geodermatophilus sp. SYSU D00815]